jgi:hypothetical protein
VLTVVDASDGAAVRSVAQDAGAVVDSGGAEAATVAVDAAAADGGGASAPPLVLKGVRKCSADEMEAEVCFEGKEPGSCMQEYCVTAARCPKYCVALAAQEHADCESDPKACEGIAECVRTIKETNKVCVTLRAHTVATCKSAVCGFILSLTPR